MNEAFYGYMILFIGMLCWVWLLSYGQIQAVKRTIKKIYNHQSVHQNGDIFYPVRFLVIGYGILIFCFIIWFLLWCIVFWLYDSKGMI